MDNWKDMHEEKEEAQALAQLLSPLQVLALHKALSPLVSQAKGLLPSGQHPCTVKVRGPFPMESISESFPCSP